MEIVTWPNPILDSPGEPVTSFGDDLKQLVSDMFETMYSAPGVGLAAVQVGVAKRLFVMDCSAGKDPDQRIVMINPEVLHVEGEQNGGSSKWPSSVTLGGDPAVTYEIMFALACSRWGIPVDVAAEPAACPTR